MGYRAWFDGQIREVLLSDINPDIAPNSDDDRPVSDPVLLDVDGGLLPSGGDPVYLNYGVMADEDWVKGLDLIENIGTEEDEIIEDEGGAA